MFKKLLSMVLCAIMVLGIGTTAFAAQPENAEDSTKALITFVENTTPAQVKTFIESNEIVMDSFIATVEAGNTVSTCGYVINTYSNFDNIWNEFVSMQTNLLSEGIAGNGSSSAKETMALTLQAINDNGLDMESVTCNSQVSQRNNMINSEIIKNIQIISEQPDTAVSATEPIAVESRATNWLPTSGSAGAWPSQNVSDATYLEAHYTWSSDSALSTLTGRSDSTLEADLVLYNYDGTALATGWYDGTGNYTYNTNQPRAYQDTQAFDNGDEPVFCVGCSDAASLKSKTDYYWIAYGNRTSSSSCKAKLNFQRGHRVIDSIYEETWNIFGDETSTVIPFSSWNTATSPSKSF